MKTRLILRGLSVWGHANLRTWEPEQLDTVAEVITAEIGHRQRTGNDSFSVRVATPAGLAGMQAHDGVIATRPLLVIDRFDFAHLWAWFESILVRCDGEDWPVCVERLRLYLDWEYDGYAER